LTEELCFVVDGDDRIVQVAEEHRATMARYLGHALWVYLPGAEPVLSPYFEDARETGEVVESTVFYAGGTMELRVAPAGSSSLAVRLRRRTELNVRTLETLARSLRTIEAELDARAPERRDRPAPASPQALPSAPPALPRATRPRRASGRGR
jgi:hypothetical protein